MSLAACLMYIRACDAVHGRIDSTLGLDLRSRKTQSEEYQKLIAVSDATTDSASAHGSQLTAQAQRAAGRGESIAGLQVLRWRGRQGLNANIRLQKHHSEGSQCASRGGSFPALRLLGATGSPSTSGQSFDPILFRAQRRIASGHLLLLFQHSVNIFELLSGALFAVLTSCARPLLHP